MKKIPLIKVVYTTADEEGETLFHIPFAITGDDSTLCGEMSDSSEEEGVIEWGWYDGEKVTCTQCLRIFRQYEGIRKIYLSQLTK